MNIQMEYYNNDLINPKTISDAVIVENDVNLSNHIIELNKYKEKLENVMK